MPLSSRQRLIFQRIETIRSVVYDTCAQLITHIYEQFLNLTVGLDFLFSLQLCLCFHVVLPFCSCVVMAALRNRAGHYIFCPVVSFFFSFFIPRLISAVADWMSTILPHMVWP